MGLSHYFNFIINISTKIKVALATTILFPITILSPASAAVSSQLRVLSSLPQQRVLSTSPVAYSRDEDNKKDS
ncbi:hypothetical protein AKJ16_DCAP18964 [Drosera capensis]